VPPRYNRLLLNLLFTSEDRSNCQNYVKILSRGDGSSSPRNAPNAPAISSGSRLRLPPGVCPFDYGNEHKTPPEILAYRNSGGRNEPGWRVRVVANKFRAGIEASSTARAKACTTR